MFMYHIDLNAFVGMASKTNGLVKSYFSLMVLSIAPFNIIKGAIASLVTELVYKRVSPIIKNLGRI